MSDLNPTPNLNEGQRRFCENYATVANATRAAIDAGYSPKSAHVQGHNLLKLPKIRAEIDRIRQERLADLGIDPHYILSRLQNIIDGGDEDAVDEDGRPIRTRPTDRIKALELLGKHHGLWVERIQHEGEVTFTLDIPRPNPTGTTIDPDADEPLELTAGGDDE